MQFYGPHFCIRLPEQKYLPLGDVNKMGPTQYLNVPICLELDVWRHSSLL